MGLLAVSAATLVYEIALTRLLSLQQFHHFAFLVVSLAVMASAGGGVLLAVIPRRAPMAALALAMAVSLSLGPPVFNLFLFDSYGVAWDLRQWLVLLADLAAASAPFLFGGWLVAALLSEAGHRANLTYAVSLVGAAVGCALGLLAHSHLGTVGAWQIAVGMAVLGAACFAAGRSRHVLLAASLAVFLLVPVAGKAFHIRLSPYKPMAIALLLPEARHTLQQWGAGSQVDVIETSSFHSFPGLSLQAGPDLPEQAAVFLDGDGPVPLTLTCPETVSAQNLAAHLPSSLVHDLRPGGRILILDAGGGLDVLAAVSRGAAEVQATARSPELRPILLGDYRGPTCGLAAAGRAQWLSEAPRAALASVPPGSMDVVLFSLSDPYRPVAAGAYSLHEDYLWTVESVRSALRALKPGGILALTRWLSTPPAEEARAFSTLLAALGEPSPAVDQLIAYRGLRTATVLYTPRAWTATERAKARAFLDENGFDPILFPGASEAEFNQFNQLPEDVYRGLFEQLLLDRNAALSAYPYDLRAATDSRPYFFHFFRWQQLPEVLARLGSTWQPFGGSGYLLVLGVLACVSLLAVFLVALPAVSARAREHRPSRRSMAYFGLIGAAFMLVEVPLIQRMTLVLVQPAVAVGLVVSTLLLASGVGSLLAGRIALKRSLAVLAAGLTVLAIVLGPALGRTLLLQSPLREMVSLLVLLPAGFLMGMPFAGGLMRLSAGGGGHVAWAWAINGAASGVAGVLAALVGLEAGTTATILLGAAAYGLSTYVVPGQATVKG